MIARRHLGLVVVAGAMTALPYAARAQDNVQLSAEGAANIGYSNNPFSETGGHTGSAVADIRISPEAVLTNERSVFVLSGSAQYQRYFRRYSDSDNYAARLDYRGTPSERVRTHLDLTYDNSIVGQNSSASIFAPTLPNIPPVSGSDLSLFGSRDRRQVGRADGDVQFTLSEYDTVTTSAYFVRTRYNRFAFLGDNDGYGGTVAYSRQINDRLQLGGQGSVAHYNYDGPQGGSTIYSARGSFNAQLAEHWKADGALGISFVSDENRGSRQTLSGNINVCRSGQHSEMCVNANRSVVPTGISGTQTETSIGLNWSDTLSERDSLFANAEYVKNGSDRLLLINRSFEYLRGTFGYQRTLRERLRFVASVRFGDIYSTGLNRASDIGGQVGVVIGFGKKK